MSRPAVRRPLALAALLALAACSRGPATPPGGATGPTGGAAAASGPAGVATPAPAAPADAGGSWLVAASILRREPSDAPRVPGPGGKPVANYVATLMRGERVAVGESKGEWVAVRTSGDEPGWLRRSSLLDAEGAAIATLLVPADVFDRPDLLAANPRRKLDPGALLLVVRQRAPFAEVNAGAGPVAWVLSDRLVTEEQAISAAKLVEKARWLKRNGKEDEAKQILELGRSAFAGSPLLDVLAVELGLAPAAPAGPAGPGGLPPGAEPAPAAAPVSPAGGAGTPPGPAGPGTPR